MSQSSSVEIKPARPLTGRSNYLPAKPGVYLNANYTVSG